MAFLSGSFFPLDNAPPWLRRVSQIFPLKHLNTAMLDVMVRGRTPEAVLPEIGILLGFAVVVTAIARSCSSGTTSSGATRWRGSTS